MGRIFKVTDVGIDVIEPSSLRGQFCIAASRNGASVEPSPAALDLDTRSPEVSSAPTPASF